MGRWACAALWASMQRQEVPGRYEASGLLS